MQTMFLKSGACIAARIRLLTNENHTTPARLAVAFWGDGAEKIIQGPSQIICDLESGACNPDAISNLLLRQNCTVLKYSGLHAKVVISTDGAVVSSANMSKNGLGGEDNSASRTIEAGYFIPNTAQEYEEIAVWFEDLWKAATEITSTDLALAKVKWESRKRDRLKLEAITNPALKINSSSLLNPKIESKDLIRAVKKEVFTQISKSFENIERHRLGKIASWACHLILVRAGVSLDYSSKKTNSSGAVTEKWITSKFGTKKYFDTVEKIEAILNIIKNDDFFSDEIRRFAESVQSTPPWRIKSNHQNS
ncbi:hypothetical protein HS961_16750 [Comamonas piscis]|uniref:Phospholipase D-like domain-containing protein n=1 Tax=Comamonas piscis TaxID=1562974 RepID=A0A7G5EK24_9BURK|nr:phospholipase D family protein [Comamonas piscis]QMV74349.1 hypothetical protein HS961_16750 [Comamonas piscis]WSO32795.1 hypothetical protein VUJ63_16795 [Comamonas piscis]